MTASRSRRDDVLGHGYPERALVLLNPEAGTLAEPDAPACWQATISAALQAREMPHRLHCGSAPELQAHARALQQQPSTLVLTGGGDGTVAAVAEVLAGSSHVLAPLPGGTANLLCRDLGLGTRLERALARVLDGDVAAIDAGRVNGALFLHQVVFGMYADLADVREAARRARPTELGDVVARLAAVVAAEPRVLRLQHDRRAIEVDTNLLIVAVNGYDSIDPPFPGRSRLDSGELVSYHARSASVISFLTLLAHCLRYGFDSDDAEHALTRLHARHIQVDAPRPLRYTVDGEPHTISDPLVLEILPGALQVTRAPPERKEKGEQEEESGR